MKKDKKVQSEKLLEKIEADVMKRLKQGKEKIVKFERQLMNKVNKEKAVAKLKQLKKKFTEKEQKAVKYVKNNPKKALAIASAAVVLAGALYAATRSKKKKKH